MREVDDPIVRLRPRLLVAASVVVALLAGCSALGAPTGSSGGSISTVRATGDRRTVDEPTIPATTCTTVGSQLSLTEGHAGEADEAAPPDTARLQSALDGCAQTASSTPVAVRLSATGSDADFLTGPLRIGSGEVLVLDSDVTVYGSTDPADYQTSGGPDCGTIGGGGNGCLPLITLTGSHSGIESHADPAGRRGRIDGRGGDPMTVAGADTGQSWWQLAASAKSGGAQNVPRLIQSSHADDVTLYDIDLVDSAGFHVSFQNGDGFTAWGVRIHTPATARNTDGIDPAGATDVTIAHSWIMDGDDGIAIKGGSAPSAHISIVDDHFYGTHGISIGSETTAGVSDVLVADDTVDGTDSLGNASASSAGVRIKSSPKAGGAVTQVTYQDVCATRTKAPLDFDTDYEKGTGGTTPSFTDIVIDGFTATASPSGAASTFRGLDAQHPLQLSLARTAVDTATVSGAFADIGVGSDVTFGGRPLAPPEASIHLIAAMPAVTADTAAPACTFPSYPAM